MLDYEELTLYRLTSSYFCCAVYVEPKSGLVVEAAPIVKWAKGNTIEYVLNYARRKSWKVERLA